jgi:hypothetical protein
MVPSQPQTERSIRESHDGFGAGDHDLPFVFGRVPRVLAPFPFSTRQLGRLMVLRSRLQAGCYGIDDFVSQQP